MYKSIVIGRNGESLAGNLLDKSFTIDSTLGMPLTFKTTDIHWIHFKNPPNIEMDEIWGVTDDRVKGKIRGSAIRLKVAGNQVVQIPYAKIHTIIVNQTFKSLGSSLSRSAGRRTRGR